MKLTLIKDYSNYYNRIIKREDYNTIITNNTYKVLEKINFITGDDIRTSQVINWTENWDPNYLVVSADGSNDIISRWYVIDHNKTRRNQYVITLKRDLVAENYDNIITSPAYVERGVLTNTSDPAIFNSENISTNQIKQWERPIMETDINNNISPYNWIVGYCQPQKPAQEGEPVPNWPAESVDMEGDVETYASWNDFPYASLFNTSNPSKNKETKANAVAFLGFADFRPIILDRFGRGKYKICAYFITVPNLGPNYYRNHSYTASGTRVGNDFYYYNSDAAVNDDLIGEYIYFDDVSGNGSSAIDILKSHGNSISSTLLNLINTNISNIYTGPNSDNFDSLVNSLNNKTVKIHNTIYKISISKNEKTERETVIVNGERITITDTSIIDGFANALNNNSSSAFYNKLQHSGKSMKLYVCSDTYTASMTVVPTPQLEIQLKGVGASASHFGDIPELNDAPYALFAIPYFNEWYTEGDLGNTYEIEAKEASDTEASDTKVNNQIALRSPQHPDIPDIPDTLLSKYKVNNKIAFASAQYISHQLQSGKFLIDLQLLPYCPLEFNIINHTYADKALQIITKASDIKNIINTSTNDVICSIFFSHSSDRERNGVCFNGTSALNVNYNNIIDLKVANQCDIYRLCSPSKSKYYDFNAAKNYGLNGFNICTTYKPFSPFIYVRPNKNMNSLYGQNFNDYVGLIATGDYVLPTETDAWTQYQIQNKNYQQIFDRQIQHQTFLNNWAVKEQEYANKANIRNATVGGALSGGLTGAMVGAKAGGLAGPYGAIGGAIIGGIGGAVGLGGNSYDLVSEGAALDMDRLISTNAENISYAKDTFNYNLQNIQALPDALVSTSSFDYINKVYPFIEYYTCTDIEKEQVRNLLTLQGMSVNKVTTIDTLNIGNSNSFTKATLYKFIGDTSNPVIVNEINAELLKGVYL